jgi:ABC-type multidrug transport system ATPase subunit
MSEWRIQLQGAGKKFNRHWVFKDLDAQFNSGQSTALQGPNGSGKSTLLQSLSGALGLNQGEIIWEKNGTVLAPDQWPRYLSYCAPYLELVEEFTAREALGFQAHFKPTLPQWNTSSILEKVDLVGAADKQIRYYSSGMKQRIKLALAFFADTPVLFLDEPCSNLDAAGIAVYQELLATCTQGRLVVIGSNDPQETQTCSAFVTLVKNA